jgi:hypothetical protein
VSSHRGKTRSFRVLANGTAPIFIFRWPYISVQLLLITKLTHFFLCFFLFPYSTCFEQPSAHHQEKRIVSINHLVYVTVCGWYNKTCRMKKITPRYISIKLNRNNPQSKKKTRVLSWPAYQAVTYTEWRIPDDVLIQLTLLMMSTGLLETWREGK